MRAALFRYIRSFFYESGFLEVDTPVKQPVLIPESNISPLRAEDDYLQTSPEICMKRLLARGCSKLFQICPCFRKEEKGRLHLEEFTMLEWYRADADYIDLMEDCKKLLHDLTEKMCREFPGEIKLEIPLKCEKITVEAAFSRYAACSVDEALKRDCFEEILVEFVEPNLGTEGPTLLYDYPAQLASLSLLKPKNKNIAERFEMYLGGIELANGFSELTDCNEQRERFQRELSDMDSRGAGLPEKFLDDLQKLDKAAGIALGVDRLFMILTGKKDVSSAVSFSPEDL